MAKKTSKNAGETTSQARFLIGISMICVGILLFIALGAFVYTGGADRSIFDLSLYDLFVNPDIVVGNPLGKLGAWVADMLMTNGVGLMAFVVPWLCAAAGLYVMGVKKVSLPRQLAYCISFAIWGSIALGFVSGKLSDRWYLLAGGTHGYFMSKWLTSAIGGIGTLTLLALTAFGFAASRNTTLRSKIVALLQRVNIRLPSIPTSTDEGAPIAPMRKAAGDNGPEKQAPPAQDDEQHDTAEDDSDAADSASAARRPDDGGMEIAYAAGDEWQNGGAGDPENKQEAQDDFEVVKIHEEEAAAASDGFGIGTKYDPTLDLADYKTPPLSLLKDYGKQNGEETQDKLVENKDKIVQTLENFQIQINTIKATVGPTVTLYEIVPAPGIRITKIRTLEDDIAMRLEALGIRILAPIPGKGTIGIEVPNSNPQIVSMQSVLRSSKFQDSDAALPIAIGKTITNETFVFDLAKTPHLLVAGATGQGKSVGLNAIITSILYKKHPSQVKFVLVDPKMVEFSLYKVLEKHFLAKMEGDDDAVVTDFDKVKGTLQSLTVEMDNRYKLLQKASVREIKEYNAKFIDRRLNPENGHRYLPYIVVIVDEFADLIMMAGKEVEMPIARIAQKARAVGIHMILATQRPTTNIITGTIKANFPSRIAFKVSQRVDSGTILDGPGAQSLIGRGDMLIKLSGSVNPTRVQCALVDTPEVEALTRYIAEQRGYSCAYELPEITVSADGTMTEGGADDPGKLDRKIREIATMVVESQIGSTSNIQRRFGVGYNRAGKIMDQLERMGIVAQQDGSKPRAVYVQTMADLERILSSFGVE